MKNWQFILLTLLIIAWFSIVIYQNQRILSYWKALDYRTIDIYKDTWNLIRQWDRIENDYLDEIRGTLRADSRILTNNPTLNTENYSE